MLDQPGEPSAQSSVPDGTMESSSQYYVPPGAAEALSGRAPMPRVKRFNRKMLAVAAVALITVVTLAFSVGLQQPKRSVAAAPEASSRSPAPGAAVSELPGTYQDYAHDSLDAPNAVPQLGDPRPGESGALAPRGTLGGSAGAAIQLTPLEQYQQQRELERLKSEDAARAAAVAFTGGGAVAAPEGLGNRRVGSVDSAALAQSDQMAAQMSEGLTDRLLDVAQHSVTGLTGGASTSARDEDNRQDDKSAFAQADRDTDFQLHHGLQIPRSPYTMFAGTVVPCVMTQGVNSDLPGQIGCMVSQNVYDTVSGRHLLLPQGTKAIGTYDSRIAYGQSRVLVVWTRLLRPDGSWVSLEGMPGTDLSGYAGLTGHVNDHYVRLLSGVVLGSIIGAAAQIGAGANNQNPSFSALSVQGAAQNINQAGQQITRKNLQIQPTIEVRPGARLNIFATRDIILPPYSG